MAGYQCPLCNKQMDRDLILFLDHTNQHVIDRIKQANPHWIEENGVCQPCMEYYRTQISGEAGNIGPGQRRKRIGIGILCLVISIAAGIYLTQSGWPRFVRLGLFVPLFFSLFCFIQAGEKTCSVLAEMGSQNMDSGSEKIQDGAVVEALKKKGRQIFLKSALGAAFVTFAFFFF